MCKFKIFLLFLLIFVISCHHQVEYYSILESAPHVDYSTSFTPELIDSKNGFSLGLGGGFSQTASQSDSSIDMYDFNLIIRARLGTVGDLGYSFTNFFVGDKQASPYNVLDAKFLILKEPVIVGPDIAFGFGAGSAGWLADARLALILGMPLINSSINPYIAPRVMGLLYPWKRETFPNRITWQTSYSISPVYGISSGISFSLPAGTAKVKFRPEISYLNGKEPQLDKITYYVLQAAFHLQMAF